MSEKVLPTRLPPQFYTLFWDTDASKVNPREKPYYVINRLLDKGDLEAVHWVLRTYQKAMIVETLKTRRDFSFKTANFWAEYLSIPKGEIKCMQEPYRSLRKMLWLD